MLVYKVVMVGDFGVGKTSLVKRFVDNSFSEEYLSTIGVSISKKKINDSTLMIWDIEGNTEFKPIFKQYLIGSKGFIIVADLHRKDTIENISKHIQLCHNVIKDAPLCIALNKSDINYNITDKEIEELKELSPYIVTILKTSAKNDDAVVELFSALNTEISSKIRG